MRSSSQKSSLHSSSRGGATTLDPPTPPHPKQQKCVHTTRNPHSERSQQKLFVSLPAVLNALQRRSRDMRKEHTKKQDSEQGKRAGELIQSCSGGGGGAPLGWGGRHHNIIPAPRATTRPPVKEENADRGAKVNQIRHAGGALNRHTASASIDCARARLHEEGRAQGSSIPGRAHTILQTERSRCPECRAGKRFISWRGYRRPARGRAGVSGARAPGTSAAPRQGRECCRPWARPHAPRRWTPRQPTLVRAMRPKRRTIRTLFLRSSTRRCGSEWVPRRQRRGGTWPGDLRSSRAAQRSKLSITGDIVPSVKRE